MLRFVPLRENHGQRLLRCELAGGFVGGWIGFRFILIFVAWLNLLPLFGCAGNSRFDSRLESTTPAEVLHEGPASVSAVRVGRSEVQCTVHQNGQPIFPSDDGAWRLRPSAFELSFNGDTDLVSLVALPGGATSAWWPTSQPSPSVTNDGSVATETVQSTTTPIATFGGTASIFAGYVPMLERPAELAPLEPEWFQQRWGTAPHRAKHLADHAQARLGSEVRLLISPRAALTTIPSQSASQDHSPGDDSTLITIDGFNESAMTPGQRVTLLILLEDPIGERLFETRWIRLPLHFGAAN